MKTRVTTVKQSSKRIALWVGLAISLLGGRVFGAELKPPKINRIVPGDRGVYVDLEKREEDVRRNMRYVVYLAETSGGPYVKATEFKAGLYKSKYGDTSGYIGSAENGKTYYFVATSKLGKTESPYSNEVGGTPVRNDEVAVPYIEGKWWRVAESAPDVAPYNKEGRNACDFTIWQDDHGKWHCVSCIRETTYPSATRLLYHWQSDNITDTDWSQDKRIFWTTGTKGEPDVLGRRLEDGPYTLQRGMQAPHCFKEDGRYYMFHNNAGCFVLSSPDGDDATFAMQPRYDGKLKFFDMGRDVMIFDNRERDGYWYAYYTVNPPDNIHARRAKNLLGPWGEPVKVPMRGFFESPFVVYHEGNYYLFEPDVVWASKDPLNFDNTFVTVLRDEDGVSKAATEVFQGKDGQYYIAGYWGGIWVAKLGWRSPVRQ